MTGFTLDTHVAEQPEMIAALLEQPGIPALDPDRPVVFTGIGTSLHACRVAAAWVRQVTGGRVRPAALDAHDLALSELVRAEDQVVVVSHRGTKRYPNVVLARAREIGAATVAVTGQGTADVVADVVVRTCPQEKASTHTLSYTSALVVLGRIVAATYGAEVLAEALAGVPEAMRWTLDQKIPAHAVDALVSSSAAIVTGTGLDAITADEAALKIKEGTYRWVEGMHAEFALHGTPAVFSSDMTAILIEPSTEDGGRTDDLRGLLGKIGATVITAGESADLAFAPTHPLVRPLVSILPFQRLVSFTATRVGSNPDLTHLEAEPWNSAIRAVSL